MPVKKKEWITPSITQSKDQFGKENRVYFVIRAHTNDGKICWRGVYHDREDFDAVLWAIANGKLKYEKELWPLSTPNWHPWYNEITSYSFITYFIRTSPTGSNQTYNKPTDWNDNNNKIECMAAGGSGSCIQTTTTTYRVSGGGGGAYSSITNFAFTGSSATYQIGTGGAAKTSSGATLITGNDGGSTWFNSTTATGVGTDNTKCGAEGGYGGTSANTPTTAIGNRGRVTQSWGTNRRAGSDSGLCQNDGSATGGGGAGCSNGGGGFGVNTSIDQSSTNGGSGGTGDTGVGSAGTAGNAGAATGSNGGNGTNLADGTIGSGGGGGGYRAFQNTTITAGSGGNYGSGGGGCYNYNGGGNAVAVSGAGIQGLIIISYTPQTYLSGQMFTIFN